MKRASTLTSAILLTVQLALSGAAAAAEDFDIEGKYQLINPPQPTSTPDKVEVVDVFWYGCPHCYSFLPVLEAYELSKPDYVEVVRMPAIFRESWEAHARAYYTAKLLGVEEALHRPIFEAINSKNQKLSTKKELEEFFEANGVSGEDFAKTYDSFAVESGIRKSMVMQGRYGIRGTPSVVVNGKYLVTGSLAGSYENMVKVIQALVDKEHDI